MRKYMFGLMAAMFVVVFASPAFAEYQENAPDDNQFEQEITSSPVECTFHNFTQHTVPEHSAYMVGDAIDFEITLSDPESRVERIVFSAGPVNKHGHIEEIFDTTVTWSPTTAGEWPIYFQLFDADGQEIIPTGDCNGMVTVLQMTDPAHPDHPDEVEMPQEPVDDTCADDDPSTLVPVSNADGSTTWYSPGGAFCGTVLPATPTAPTPVQPAAKPAAQPEAVVATATMAELPHTGAKELLMLTLFGVTLLLAGFVLVSRTNQFLSARQ